MMFYVNDVIHCPCYLSSLNGSLDGLKMRYTGAKYVHK